MQATRSESGTTNHLMALRTGTEYKTVSDIPKVWLVKSRREIREYPTLRLLEKPTFGPAEKEVRCFLIVELTDKKESNTVLRLGSFCSNSNRSHIDLARRLTLDVKKLGESCSIEWLGRGAIQADYKDRTIKVVCGHGAFQPADLLQTAELLRAGLGDEYKGFQVILNVSGEIRYEKKTVM